MSLWFPLGLQVLVQLLEYFQVGWPQIIHATTNTEVVATKTGYTANLLLKLKNNNTIFKKFFLHLLMRFIHTVIIKSFRLSPVLFLLCPQESFINEKHVFSCQHGPRECYGNVVQVRNSFEICDSLPEVWIYISGIRSVIHRLLLMIVRLAPFIFWPWRIRHCPSGSSIACSGQEILHLPAKLWIFSQFALTWQLPILCKYPSIPFKIPLALM